MACVSEGFSLTLFFLRVLICSAATVVAGCVISTPTPRTYAAVIERVDERSGDYYSPKNGVTPLVCLHLRVASSSGSDGEGTLRVFLADLYSPEIHGRPGDSVSFSYERTLPMSGELNFSALVNYHIARTAR